MLCHIQTHIAYWTDFIKGRSESSNSLQQCGKLYFLAYNCFKYSVHMFELAATTLGCTRREGITRASRPVLFIILRQQIDSQQTRPCSFCVRGTSPLGGKEVQKRKRKKVSNAIFLGVQGNDATLTPGAWGFP